MNRHRTKSSSKFIKRQRFLKHAYYTLFMVTENYTGSMTSYGAAKFGMCDLRQIERYLNSNIMENTFCRHLQFLF